MKLKLSNWASIAEIISSAAVVVTLVVLIMEVQDNTNVIRAQVNDSNIDRLNGMRQMTIEDPDIARLYSIYASEQFDTVEPYSNDYVRLINLIDMQFGAYEEVYFDWKYEVLGPSEWSRWESAICRQLDRVRKSQPLHDGIRRTLTPEFFDFAEHELCPQAPE